ncbi:MAG TPA: DNA gyrase subunit A [Alphaproteobacteria bacterium]|nr:DNA gyrase subunit A [Alphaproteobacteria bacterium]
MTDNAAQAPSDLPPSDITPVTIEEEMRRSYLDYAMSVIVSRALPDVRDGLKPVHRRILFAMKEGGYDSSKAYKKSARIVGDVMGKYHPHGDSAIYDAMVRMAQDFSMRLPLIDGQGNFGSMDGDNAAAMRYTEARLAKAAETLLEDIDKETVDFHPNYDESQQEPDVLPARYPNLLVNGAGGIAVGMATNIPPHNLGEVIDATLAQIKNPEITLDELIEIVPGPDFPTGGIILGHMGCKAAAFTGRGSVTMRARTNIEEIRKDRQAIIVTEIPYQVNKVRLIERISECVNEKIIEGISDLRDESDRDGVRVVVELKRDAMADIVLNQLYAHTQLQTNFPVNLLALNDGRPQQMNLKDVLTAFIMFREKVITRRTEFELGQARARAHILAGLAIAVANIDEVIALIRKANDPVVAKAELMARAWPVKDVGPLIALVDGEAAIKDGTYKMTEIQAKAILDLRLHRLTGLEREKISADLNEVVANIKDYLDILANRSRIFQIMSDELLEIRNKFATPRKTTIEAQEFESDIEDLIQRESMVVTVSHAGYVKRVPLSTYRAQKRGGKGRTGMSTKDEDFVNDIFVASTHTPMLFFSTLGRVYKLKVYKLPLGNPQSRGKALVNLLPLEQNETITTVMHLPEDEATWDKLNVMFATSAGTVRRNQLSDFSNVRPSGIIAMKLEEGDKLISVQTCTESNDVLLASRQGKSIRFAVEDVRVFTGRTSVGVRGVKLADKDDVISMSILHHVDASAEERVAYIRQANAARRAAGEATEEQGGNDEEATANITLSAERFAELAKQEEFLLTVSQRGFGKRTSAYEYRITNRGGQGIWNMEMSERNGLIVATFPVKDEQDIMLVSDGGQIIRMPVKDIRIAGRKTQGVTVFRVDESEKVVSVAALEDMSGEGEGGEGADVVAEEGTNDAEA